MTVLNFAPSPVVGQTYFENNVFYTFDGVKWTARASGGSGGSTDKIEEGNTSAEVIDTGSDGRFVVTTEGTERLHVTNTGRVGIGIANPTHALTIGGISSTPGDFKGLAFQSGSTVSNYIRSVCQDGNNYALAFGTYNSGISEKARLDSLGRLLVGATSTSANTRVVIAGRSDSNPAGTLMMEGTNTSPANNDTLGVIRFSASGPTGSNAGAAISANRDGGTWTNNSSMPTSLVFATTADGKGTTTERMRIGQNGNVLINTTTSGGGIGFATKLVVDGGALGDTAVLKNSAGSSAIPLYCWNAGTTGDNSFVAFGTETSYTRRGLINYNRGSGVVAYNTTSDYRAKTLVGQVENPGATIDALKVYRGVMNGATVERPMLVAHEAQEVAPYCVTGQKDAVDDKGDPIYQQMDHQVLVPLLIAEIQQLRARVAALETP